MYETIFISKIEIEIKLMFQSSSTSSSKYNGLRILRDLHMDVSITSYNYQDNAMHLLDKLY